MKEYFLQSQDDLVQVEQELQESMKEYILVCKNENSPIQYVKVKATSEQDAIKEIKKTVPYSIKVLKVYLSNELQNKTC